MTATPPSSNTAESTPASRVEAGRRAPRGDYVRQAKKLQELASDLLTQAVIAERARETPWEDIGSALGVTKSTAHGRYSPAMTSWLEGKGQLDHDASPDGWFHEAFDALDQKWRQVRGLGNQQELQEDLRVLADTVSPYESALASTGGFNLPCMYVYLDMAAGCSRLEKPRTPHNGDGSPPTDVLKRCLQPKLLVDEAARDRETERRLAENQTSATRSMALAASLLSGRSSTEVLAATRSLLADVSVRPGMEGSDSETSGGPAAGGPTIADNMEARLAALERRVEQLEAAEAERRLASSTAKPS